MQDATPVLRRCGQLCASLDSDTELRDELEHAGFSGRHWDELADAIRTGSPHAMSALLDQAEQAAAAAGIDGVTYPTREYRSLPNDPPEYRTISGWRCPHQNRCGRVQPSDDPADVQRCAITGDTLTWISVDSR
jgi:hypothetical protein